MNNFFFFQAEDGIRDFHVTGVQTCALPILRLKSIFQCQSSDISQRKLWIARSLCKGLQIDAALRISCGDYGLVAAKQPADNTAVEEHIAIYHYQMSKVWLPEEYIGKVVSSSRDIAAIKHDEIDAPANILYS